MREDLGQHVGPRAPDGVGVDASWRAGAPGRRAVGAAVPARVLGRSCRCRPLGRRSVRRLRPPGRALRSSRGRWTVRVALGSGRSCRGGLCAGRCSAALTARAAPLRAAGPAAARPAAVGRLRLAAAGRLGPASGEAASRGGGRQQGPGRGRRPERLAPAAARRAPADVQPPLQAVEPGGVAALTGGAGQQHPRADQLQLQPRRGGAAHLGQPGVDDVGRPRQRPGAERGRLLAHPLELVLGHAAQHRRRAVRDGGDDDEVAQPLEHVLDEASRVVPGLDHLVDLLEDGGGAAGGQAVDGGVEQLAVGEAQQRGRTLVGQPPLPRAGDQLVEDGERVTDRARRRRGRRRRARPARPPPTRPRTARRGSPAAAAAAPGGTGSGGSASGSCR